MKIFIYALCASFLIGQISMAEQQNLGIEGSKEVGYPKKMEDLFPEYFVSLCYSNENIYKERGKLMHELLKKTIVCYDETRVTTIFWVDASKVEAAEKIIKELGFEVLFYKKEDMVYQRRVIQYESVKSLPKP